MSNRHGKNKEYDVCLTTHPPPPYVLLFSRSLFRLFRRCVYCKMFKINVRLLESPEISSAVTTYTSNMQQMRVHVRQANMVTKRIYTFLCRMFLCYIAFNGQVMPWCRHENYLCSGLMDKNSNRTIN